MKKLLIIISACVLFCSCAMEKDKEGIVSSSSAKETTATEYEQTTINEELIEDELPNYVVCKDILFRFGGRIIPLSEIDISKEEYLGTIRKTVNDMPEENFEANFPCEGMDIYSYSEDGIIIIRYTDPFGEPLKEGEALFCYPE